MKPTFASRRIARFTAIVSAALMVLILTAYATRADALAALTLYPFWCWSLLGSLVAAVGYTFARNKGSVFVGAAWLFSAALFADGIIPVLRGLLPEKPLRNGTLRIISLNCAGTAEAMNEAIALRPDVVLLQEVPGTNQVATLARKLFGTDGSYVSGFDCAIIARGPMKPLAINAPYYVTAFVTIGSNAPMMVTSLRLIPPETRSDLWRPEAWRAYTENRKERRRQLTDVMFSVPNAPRAHIVGGDFNAPGRDGIFRLMDGYVDTYAAAGRGWGHTALNNIPVSRPDQIWTRGLAAHSVRALKTIHSDHRMVIAEVTQ